MSNSSDDYQDDFELDQSSPTKAGALGHLDHPV